MCICRCRDINNACKHAMRSRGCRVTGTTTTSQLAVKPASDSDKMSSLETTTGRQTVVLYSTVLTLVCMSVRSVAPSTTHIASGRYRQLLGYTAISLIATASKTH
jgi:hypothetical protein